MKATNVISILLITITTIVSSFFIVRCVPKMSESIEDKTIGLNGGFEHVKNTLPINWLVYTSKTVKKGEFEIMYDTSDFKEGKQSLKFDVKSCSDKGAWHSPGIAQEISVNPKEEYLISFWVKNKGPHFQVNITGVTATEKADGPKLDSSEDINDWQKFEYKYKIPENMKRIRIEVSVLKPGQFWIDDVKIEKIN